MPAGAGKPVRRAQKTAAGARRSRAKPRSRWLTRFLPFGLPVFLGVAALYGLALGGQLERFSASAGFGVERVIVSARSEVRRNAVFKALDVEFGRPLLTYDCGSARARLLQLSWVKEASVQRVLPGTITVDVVERQPIAIWQDAGRLSLIDAEGNLIGPAEMTDLALFPHVVGKGAAQKAGALLRILARFPEIESRVRAAVRVADRRWNLSLSNGINVALPAENMEAAIALLLKLDREQAILSRKINLIDLRFKDRVILRLPESTSQTESGSSKAT